MASPVAKVLEKAIEFIAPLAIKIEDKPNGHYRVKVLGIPFFDSERREARLARRAARQIARTAARKPHPSNKEPVCADPASTDEDD